MSERQFERSMGVWVRPLSVPTGVRSIAVVGTWLALTNLFLFASIVLLGTAISTVESLPVVSSLLALIGVLGACGVSPTLAWVVVSKAVERFEATLQRVSDCESDVPSPCDTGGRAYCRTSRECCC